MATRCWTPECTEDELLVAMIAVKRAFQSQDMWADPGTFPVMHLLAAHGPSRQAPLAEALGLDASTVSRHVRALVEQGWVSASRDPHDGRATVLSITEQGSAHLTERLRTQRASLQAATAHLSEQERTELVRLLRKLAAALAAQKENA
jgi:DNA-binding MarR family transcriptional regulator